MRQFLHRLRALVHCPDFMPIVVVLVVGLIAGRFLLQPGYYNMHDDLQMMRQLEMEKCLLDGQIPCRWVPDMGYGFGFPLFNYYPPLPYLVGELFRISGFSFVDTVKATFFLTFILSGMSMYLVAREFWGRLGGILSAAFYIWAPYHALDVYVRGAMNEAWALVWFPAILLTSYKLILNKKNDFIWLTALAISWAGLLMSHNLMVLVFSPLSFFWVLFWIWQTKKWKKILQLAISGVLAFGLSAFFVLPLILERDLVQLDTLVVGYYDYIVHFASLNQLLISRFWGYGASAWGLDDDMSFQVGHLHWILSLFLGGFLILKIIKKRFRKIDFPVYIVFLFLASGWFATFMAHLRSIFIWKAIPPLKFVQFPWRFVILSILSFSMLVGAVVPLMVGKIRKTLQWLFVTVLIISVIFLGKDYFKPEKMGPLTDKEKFSGVAWDKLQTAGIFDYLPKAAKTAPKAPQIAVAVIIEGEGKILKPRQGTNWAEFNADIASESAVIQIGIMEFPDWRVFVDGKQVETYIGDDEWGRMHVDLKRGRHKVYARLYDTPPRTIGNLISFVSWGLLIASSLWRKRAKI